MIKGINGKSYINLEDAIDHASFTDLHPEICRGFAKGKHLAVVGNLEVPDGFMHTAILDGSFIPLYQTYNKFLNLSNDDPVRINGQNLTDAELAKYLKFVSRGYDLYSFYVLCDFENGWRDASVPRKISPMAEYFPNVVEWIQNLITLNVFSNVGRATFFVQEAGGVSFEHKDPAVDPEYPNMTSEFIHIRPTIYRPFYVRDNESLEKHYVNSCVGYWNDQDWHGGDPVMEPSYALRVDGVFTDEFRRRALNG